VILEITETSVTSERERPVLERLAAMGIRVALDDFGVGFASLDNLRRLPVQVLKLDKSFVSGVTRPGADRAIVRVVVDLATPSGCRSSPRASRPRSRPRRCACWAARPRRGTCSRRPGPTRSGRRHGRRARCRRRRGRAARATATTGRQTSRPRCVGAARLLARGPDPHRSAVHAVATALSRRCGLGQRAQRR
jgi:predicted signal transduction protein with EAL and GGDEF domain